MAAEITRLVATMEDAQNCSMGVPDERREERELVEPLFAGLSGAEEPREADPDPAEADEADEGPTDPWKHPRPAHLPSESVPLQDIDAESATFPLVMKALLLLIALVAISAFVYFAFGV
jgi:hypothetical protein